MADASRTKPFSRPLLRPEPAAVLWVKRVCIAAFAIHMLFFTWSIYRRLRQIIHIELTSSDMVLTAGTTVSYDVIASGEVRNRIRLELVQGTHAETLREELSRVNYISSYDPRIFRYQRSQRITTQLLAHFESGPATLRLTGFGSQKLLQTPAPRVRELAVQIR
jgi:hypothetical protein